MPCIAANDGGTIRCVLLRDMALELEPGIYVVPGVDVTDRHTLAAPEELAVPTRGGRSPCRAIGSISPPPLEGAGLDLTWQACAYRLTGLGVPFAISSPPSTSWRSETSRLRASVSRSRASRNCLEVRAGGLPLKRPQAPPAASPADVRSLIR